VTVGKLCPDDLREGPVDDRSDEMVLEPCIGHGALEMRPELGNGGRALALLDEILERPHALFLSAKHELV
jgi:hypothetical protein